MQQTTFLGSAGRLIAIVVAAIVLGIPFQFHGSRERLLREDAVADLIDLDAAKEQYAVEGRRILDEQGNETFDANGRPKRAKVNRGDEVIGGIKMMVDLFLLNQAPRLTGLGTYDVGVIGKDPTFEPVKPLDSGEITLPVEFSELTSELEAPELP